MNLVLSVRHLFAAINNSHFVQAIAPLTRPTTALQHLEGWGDRLNELKVQSRDVKVIIEPRYLEWS
jgi:hypothetical protein